MSNDFGNKQNNIERYEAIIKRTPRGRHIYDMEYLSYKLLSEWILIGEVDLDDAYVANLGCGECLEERWFLPRVYKWDSYDYTPGVIDVAKREIKTLFSNHISEKFSGYVADFSKSDFISTEGKYDVVLCLSVLEHFSDKNDIIKALQNIHSMMKPTGKAVISISSANNDLYMHFVREKIETGEFAWEQPIVPNLFEDMLAHVGFRVIKISSEMHICNSSYNEFLQKINNALIPLGSRIGFLIEKEDSAK